MPRRAYFARRVATTPHRVHSTTSTLPAPPKPNLTSITRNLCNPTLHKDFPTFSGSFIVFLIDDNSNYRHSSLLYPKHIGLGLSFYILG